MAVVVRFVQGVPGPRVAFIPGFAVAVKFVLPKRNALVDEGEVSGIFIVVVASSVAVLAVLVSCISQTWMFLRSFELALKLKVYVATATALGLLKELLLILCILKV